MARLKGSCVAACRHTKRDCWHDESVIIRRFVSGKFLIENPKGHVRAAAIENLIFTDNESHIFGLD